MVKTCPFNVATTRPLCDDECALSINGECAIAYIAKSFRHREIMKAACSKLTDMKYGTLSENYTDTDSVKEDLTNENTD